MASVTELRKVRDRKKSDYVVRTRFVDADGEPRYINHLVAEDSPYLLQHAHNPVDWYPWGRAAFDKAAAENKPVFLSIGYSTCHWCHVMEEESFDNEDVADFLNRDFVAIKVDREQRPDLDEYYMTGVQFVTGRGGWPMSNFLTPDGIPFFGGTYFPRAQFLHLLEQVHSTWLAKPDRLRADADGIDQAIQRQLAPTPGDALPADLVGRVVEALTEHADITHGGFGTAPKFPQEPNLILLAEHIARDPRPLAEQPAWTALARALDAMLAGGIYDQVAGGFHRYATDAGWQVPHFEKMLYNQGQLAAVYLDAWQLSGEPEYRRIVEETLDYVIREMQAPEGGFYSATDADSEGEEGRFFVWHHDELAAALDAEQLAFCETVFGATHGGNFEGANILHLPRPLAASAGALDLSQEVFDQRLQALRQCLYQARAQRPKPLRDDKHIVEWNGMVITALARAALALNRPDYCEAASRAADYLWQTHHDANTGTLWRTSLRGTASVSAQLEDHAHLLDGLIALYDATENAEWLARAQSLLAQTKTAHWDNEAGGFFGPPPQADGPQPLRTKSLVDNATVSGNSLMPNILLALYERTGDPNLRELADAQIAAFSGHIAEVPLAGPVFLTSLYRRQEPTPTALQYLGNGAIRAQTNYERRDAAGGRFTVKLSIRDGWHIQPVGDGPEATRLSLVLDEGQTPASNKTRVIDKTDDTPLVGRVTLEIEPTVVEPLIVELRLQACTDRECLPRESRRFIDHALDDLPNPPDQNV